MKTIEEIILTLIQDQKLVFLAGVGQFSVERQSASIHPVTHEMTPPHSVLKFSKTLTGDDQQLVMAVKSAQNISIEEASAKVSQFLSILKNTFENTKIFSIDRVCNVKTVALNEYEVLVNEGVIVDKNDIGLNQIKTELPQIKPVEVAPVKPIVPITPAIEPEKEVIIKKETKVMEEQNNLTPEVTPTANPQVTPENPQPKKKSKKGVWIVIIFLLIAALGVVGYLFKEDVMGLIGSKTEEKTDTTIVKEIIEEVVVKDTTVLADTAVATTEPVVEQPVVEQPVEQATVAQPVKTKVSTGEKADLSVIVYAPKNAGKYYVIAMSFKDLGNASKGVKQLKRKGYNPVVIDKNEQGLYRVAYKPGYDTERLARDFADELYEKQNLDPWIVKY